MIQIGSRSEVILKMKEIMIEWFLPYFCTAHGSNTTGSIYHSKTSERGGVTLFQGAITMKICGIAKSTHQSKKPTNIDNNDRINKKLWISGFRRFTPFSILMREYAYV
jgi:hypothetical protein